MAASFDPTVGDPGLEDVRQLHPEQDEHPDEIDREESQQDQRQGAGDQVHRPRAFT